VREIAAEVVGERGHGRIALDRVLLQRRGDDRVEIAFQQPAELLRGRRSPRSVPLEFFDARRFVSRDLPLGIERARRFFGNGVRQPPWIGVEDCLDQIGGRPHPKAVGMLTGQQEIQQHAQRVDIGGSGDLTSPDLFRRGILGRQRDGALACQRAPLVRLKKLGDPEVEELDLPVAGDEDVGRLQTAMDDKVGVSVRDRRQNVEEKANPGLYPERVRVAVGVDRVAIDIFEDEVRLPRRGDTGIEQASDVRMRQPPEEPAFAPEAFLGARVTRLPANPRVHQRRVEELDRGARLEPAIKPFREPDRSHAAVPDRRNQPIGADEFARQ
jgi:hypothetical protein